MESRKTYVIDFYDKFECIGGSCPYTCCKGWQIAIDDETYSRYCNMAFPKNIIYRFLSGKKDGIRSIRKVNSTCPFYTTEGLCRFHKTGQEVMMPKVCRQYPRTSICFGQYNEVTLELSCIRAAELFVENIGRHQFVESKTLVEENWTIGNDSPRFLELLRCDREKILNYLWQQDEEQSTLAQKIYQIYMYVYVENQYISRNDMDSALALHIPLLQEEQAKYNIPVISSVAGHFPFYPVWFLNHIIYDKFSSSALKKKNRYLYDLVKGYEVLFGDLSEKEADAFFEKTFDEMCQKQPEMELFFCSYFSYLIEQMYCKAYEDYYVLGQGLLAIIDLQFMMQFMLVHYMRDGRLEPVDISEILANTERAIRHNLILNDDILYKIRHSFFDIR